MIDLTGNFDQFLSQLAAEEKRLMLEVDAWYRKTVFDIFREIVVASPQYSGNLTSNWRLGVNFENNYYMQAPEKSDSAANYTIINPSIRGADPAVSRALSAAKYDAENFTIRDIVYITNTTPYADEVEAGIPPSGTDWRPGNLIDGRIAMIAYAYERFK